MMKTQNVWTDNIKLGQEFVAAGKRAEVVVQRKRKSGETIHRDTELPASLV